MPVLVEIIEAVCARLAHDWPLRTLQIQFAINLNQLILLTPL
jgi:hypothetical protein